MDTTYHTPVMLPKCLEALNIQVNGKYADLTFGGGGHSRAILDKLDGGKLYAFDQDDDAMKQAEKIKNANFIFIKSNFRYITKFLKLYKGTPLDGILMDLGVSSHQIDQPERGFMFRHDAPLDMRMNQENNFTAKELLETYSESQLHKIFGMYGEVKNAKNLARGIVAYRVNKSIETTSELVNILNKFAPKYHEYKYFAQVFQALRIEVNEEMKVLEEMLAQVNGVMKSGGRLVVLSYHSLEDRIVKNFMQTGKTFGEEEKDLYGNSLNPFKILTRKPIGADENEITQNNRARSAKLRIAEKK